MFKIGIPTRMIIENDTKKEFVNIDYLKLLSNFDLIPIFIPFSLSNNDEILSICDGFLIPGGDDIDAKYYHQLNHEKNSLVDERVDKNDFKVLDYAIKNNKPVLGICRGLQLINVYFKGDLIQHIENDIHKNSINHQLIMNSNSIFYNFNHPTRLINSFHHQKIGKLGEGLIVDGTSLDAIELIHHLSYPLIACQFHIERMNDEFTKEIMDYFMSLFK